MSKSAKARRNPLILFACVFLALVLAFGAVFAIAAGRRIASYTVRYGSTGATAGAVNYLALTYKRSLLSSLRSSGAVTSVPVGDTEAFWASDAGEGKTYRDLLTEGIAGYVSDILVAASLFDRATSLSKEEKQKIDSLIAEVVSYKAGGSEETYENAVAPCGFSLSDVKSAVTLQYKAGQAASALYGIDGSEILSETEYLAAFLEGYTHVTLFYVEKGNTEALGAVRSAIAGTAETQISPEQFALLRDRYDLSTDITVTEGFYFREGSEYTNLYREHYPETVDAALSMAIGEYKETETSIGICFLYRYAVTPGAYSMEANKSFFTDFSALAANARFGELIDALGEEVVFTEKYNAAALAALPYEKFYPYCVRY